MRLITENYFIKPLNLYELELLVNSVENDTDFELACYDPNVFSWEFVKALKETYVPAVKRHPKEYLLFTLWLLISKKENRIQGAISFYHLPLEKKHLEISYQVFDLSNEGVLILETLAGTLKWLTEEYNFSKVRFSNDYESITDQCFFEKGFQKFDNNLYIKQ